MDGEEEGGDADDAGRTSIVYQSVVVVAWAPAAPTRQVAVATATAATNS